MSAKVINFKKFELSAVSKAAAKEEVEANHFGIMGDATQAYKKAKEAAVNGWTDKEIKAFCMDYLDKKSKMVPGAGFMVTLESAVADTRERPYKITNVTNEDGKRKQTRTLTWIDDETGKTVCKVRGTKTEANNAIKELYKSGEYKGNATCHIIYEVTEGNPIVAKAQYAPSKNTKNGTWLVFGIEA